MQCVTTRFRVANPWQLVQLYRAYRHMHADLASAPGLVRYAFLVESLRVCCTLSIWESREAMERFSSTSNHPVRYAKRICLEIWSTTWELDAISKYASAWTGGVEWPALVPHPQQPWRLVEPAVADVARQTESHNAHEDGTLATVSASGTSQSWDWHGAGRRGTRGE